MFKQQYMINKSIVFNDILEGEGPSVQYMINIIQYGARYMFFFYKKTAYDLWYYLVDDIYLEWVTLVKIIKMLQGDKRKLLA